MIKKQKYTQPPISTQQPQRSNKVLKNILFISTLALGLSACGGDGGGGSSSSTIPVKGDKPNNDTPTSPNTTTFSESAEWTVDGTKTGESCFDFDTQSDIDCSLDGWDIKFVNESRSISLWTNGGISGDGKGASFYTMPWNELLAINNAQELPTVGFKADAGAGVFDENPWYEYNLNEQHRIFPNNRVYLVTTDASSASTQSLVSSPVYALQVINYYDDAGRSGYPTVRWIDTALPNQVKTQTLDATSNEDWVYLNLATGNTTDKDGDWQIGFNRYNVVLNGGVSGDGNVGGYVAKTPNGYYDASGTLNKAKFLEDNIQGSLTDLTQVSEYDVDPEGVPWVVDKSGSQLNPEPKGNYPAIDFGWYVYRGDQGHRLFAKPEEERIGALIRSAEGNSYAKMYLDNIEYADGSATPAKWHYKLQIQPAS